jgi:hypothetical protein
MSTHNYHLKCTPKAVGDSMKSVHVLYGASNYRNEYRAEIASLCCDEGTSSALDKLLRRYRP